MAKYNKASDLLVLDLINDTNVNEDTQLSIDLKVGEVVFGKPVAIAPNTPIKPVDPVEPGEGGGEDGETPTEPVSATTDLGTLLKAAPQDEVMKDWNTELLVTATRSSPYVGSVTVEYDRLDLERLFRNIAVNLDVKGAKTTSDLLARLNARYGLAIAKEEVVEEPVPERNEENPVVNHTIKIKDTSLVYIGELAVTIGEDADVGERLNLVITKTRLDGMHYPVDGTEKGQAYIYSFGVDCNAIRTFLSTLATGGDIVDTALAKELNKVVPEIWVADDNLMDYNVRGSKIVFAGSTSDEEAVDSNTSFNSVVIISLDDTKCSNFAGDLYLHYNA